MKCEKRLLFVMMLFGLAAGCAAQQSKVKLTRHVLTDLNYGRGEFLFLKRGELYSFASQVAQPRKLLDLENVHIVDGAYSPNGRSLVFIASHGGKLLYPPQTYLQHYVLYILSRDDGQLTKLTQIEDYSPNPLNYMLWSSDNQQVAVTYCKSSFVIEYDGLKGKPCRFMTAAFDLEGNRAAVGEVLRRSGVKEGEEAFLTPSFNQQYEAYVTIEFSHTRRRASFLEEAIWGIMAPGPLTMLRFAFWVRDTKTGETKRVFSKVAWDGTPYGRLVWTPDNKFLIFRWEDDIYQVEMAKGFPVHQIASSPWSSDYSEGFHEFLGYSSEPTRFFDQQISPRLSAQPPSAEPSDQLRQVIEQAKAALRHQGTNPMERLYALKFYRLVSQNDQDPLIQETLPVVVRYLEDQAPRIQVPAANVLREVRYQPAVTQLLLLLKDSNVRWAAVWALEEIVDHNSIPDAQYHQAIEDLLRLVNEKDFNAQSHAQRVLEKVADRRAIPPLSHLLQDKRAEPWKRTWAVRLLGHIGDASAMEAVVDCLLSDPRQEVRAACEEVLESVATYDAGIVETLEAALQRAQRMRREQQEASLHKAIAVIQRKAPETYE